MTTLTMPRVAPKKKRAGDIADVRHRPDIGRQIDADEFVTDHAARRTAKAKARLAGRVNDDDDDGRRDDGRGHVKLAGGEVIPARLSRKILDLAREQQEEEVDAISAAMADDAPRAAAASARGKSALASVGAAVAARHSAHRLEDDGDEDDDDDDDDEEDDDDDDADFAFGGGGDDVAGDNIMPSLEDGYVTHEASAEDASLFEKLMAAQTGERQNLADIIESQIRRAEADARSSSRRKGKGSGQDGKRSTTVMAAVAAAADAAMTDADDHAADDGEADDDGEVEFSDRVVKVFRDVGDLLSKYRSGRLPKVLKILPGMAGWEEMLQLTAPESWTPHAVFALTRVFSSNLNAVRAQRFFNLFLLPAVRADMEEQGKLNYHLYQALRKALYKPAAWYKGILLPLAASGDCSLREATIVGSVLTTKRVPQLQSAAAIFKLATMRYNPAISIFLRVLINKKYALPYRVVDVLVQHFLAFATLPAPLPVLWHQSLLSFAQRYKESLTRAQKEALKPLLSAQFHAGITPEVRREIFTARSREDSPDATMAHPTATAAADGSTTRRRGPDDDDDDDAME